MSARGSLSEFRLLAKNLLKLPDGFRVRPRTLIMAASGWEGEILLCNAGASGKFLLVPGIFLSF